jgi:predicted alpha/beta hydrolase family esterase
MKTIYLVVPGVTNSSPQHRQSLWEKEFPERFRRIEQAEWNKPVCDDWTATIEAEVQKESPERVVLVAHSLGCTAVAQWAKRFGTPIKGALLASPPRRPRARPAVRRSHGARRGACSSTRHCRARATTSPSPST